MSDPATPQRVPLGLSRSRYFWRRCCALVENHPLLSIAAALAVVLAIGLLGYALGGAQRPTLAYAAEAYRLWKLQTFGGEQPVDRVINVFDEILIFGGAGEGGDRLDIAATSLYVTGTAFRNQLRDFIDRGGQVRILVLDPRITRDKHAPLFQQLAEQFGQTTWELRAECLHSAAVLLRLSDELGSNFQVRLYHDPASTAAEPYLLPARSYHRYASGDPSSRFDIVVPYRPVDEGLDSPLRQAWRLKDRPDSPHLKPCLVAFEELWPDAEPIQSIRAELEAQ